MCGAKCLYTHLCMVYVYLYKITEGTRPLPAAALVFCRRYLIVAPWPMPVAPSRYLIVVHRP